MNIKSLFLAVLFLITSQLYASNLLKLSNHPLTTSHCNLEVTSNILDLALTNDGYFVVSSGKKDSELLFTRFGTFMLNSHNYIIDSSGQYLLGINKKSDPTKLSKLKIFTHNLPPKKTSTINTVINLPAAASNNEDFTTSATLYDSVSNHHVLTVDYKKISFNTWSAQVSIDNVKLNSGTLTFASTGELSNQEGLSNIQWATDYGSNKLKIDYSRSTSFAAPFNVQLISNDGYPVGTLVGLQVDRSGAIILVYSNGISKALKNTIAVAKFLNPNFLERVVWHLYKTTEKSGPPRLHKVNSDGAVLSGYLEPDPCPAS